MNVPEIIYLNLKKSKKKDSDRVGETGSNAGQKNTLIPGYVQNAEQTESTLWQRVHKSKGDQ